MALDEDQPQIPWQNKLESRWAGAWGGFTIGCLSFGALLAVVIAIAWVLRALFMRPGG
jgi:hypothetical protein